MASDFLDKAPERGRTLPYTVSDDGQVVVGVGDRAGRTADLDRSDGLVRVDDYLTDNGITEHRNVEMVFATKVSLDGKRIAGTEYWRASNQTGRAGF